MQRGPIEQLKVAVIGDGTVGKTSLLYSFSSNVFPGEYLPTYDTDHFAAIVTFHGAHYRLLLWDSPGQDELFEPIRQILLQQVDVVLVCYAIDSAVSLHNARYRWIPDLRHMIPDTPMIIVGTKSDLRPPRRHLAPVPASGCYTPIRLSTKGKQSSDKSPIKSRLAVSSKLSPVISPSKSLKSIGSPTRDQMIVPSSKSIGSPTHDHVMAPSSPASLSPISPRRNISSSNSLILGDDVQMDNGDVESSEKDSSLPKPNFLPPSPSKSPQSVSSARLVEYTEGLQLAREVGASAYVECSALTRAGMDGVFQETCAAYCVKHDKLYKSTSGRQVNRWKGRNLTHRMSFRKRV